jgi:RNA polymerase sigma-70 factor (ECF subfamily)
MSLPAGSRAEEETALITRILEGESEVYAVLVQRYNGALYRYLLRLVKRIEEAEDLLQEAYLRAYLSLASYDSTYRFSTWLYRIATNLALNRLKAEKRLISLEGMSDRLDDAPLELVDERDDCRPEVHTERVEIARQVQRCLEELPDAYRAVMALRYVADLPYAEIAEITGLPLNTVRTRLHRGRERLGECLEKNPAEEEC